MNNQSLFQKKYAEDRKFGTSEEDKQLDKLKTAFGDDLEKIQSRWSRMDYKSSNCYVEMKSRRCNHNTYETTMVGEGKLKYAEKREVPTYFAFNFQDGIYYWKYNKEDIENGKVTFSEGGRYDRGRIEKDMYAYIEKDLLKPI